MSELLEATDVSVRFEGRDAVRNVSLTLSSGEVLGIVGDSGAGKSSLAKALVGLVPLTSGRVLVEGRPVARARRLIQPVFQDASSALDPHWSIGRSLDEPMAIHRMPGRRERVAALLESVQLSASLSTRRPHELSAGQRQRVNLARALALEPKVLVLDEPVSALDVSVQAQVLNLLNQLKAQRNLSLIFISHDLDVVRYLADRVAVMRDGQFVVG